MNGERAARRALVEAGIALTSELSLDGVLRRLLEAAAQLTGARYVALGVLDRPGERLERFVSHGMTPEQEAAVGDPPSGRGILGALLDDARPLRLEDIADDPRSVGFPPGHPPMRAFLGVPILLRGVPYGNLYLTEKEDGEPFSAEDEEIVTLLAAQAAVAIELSQRIARDALHRAVKAQEVERRRLARELHDETGQALTSILLGLGAIERARDHDEVKSAVTEVRRLVVETLEDVRNLAVELRPRALDDFGLLPALKRLAQSVREQLDLDVQVEASGDVRLPEDLETAVYRIVQEAVTNAVKHADARHVSIVLTRKQGRISVVIEDDGQGFDPAQEGGDGLGLLGMRERVELLDGVVSIDAAPGAGTTLVVELPVREAA